MIKIGALFKSWYRSPPRSGNPLYDQDQDFLLFAEPFSHFRGHFSSSKPQPHFFLSRIFEHFLKITHPFSNFRELFSFWGPLNFLLVLSRKIKKKIASKSSKIQTPLYQNKNLTEKPQPHPLSTFTSCSLFIILCNPL